MGRSDEVSRITLSLIRINEILLLQGKEGNKNCTLVRLGALGKLLYRYVLVE